MRALILIFVSAQALAGGLDLDQSEQQLRVAGAYGLSYTANSIYREMGASKFSSAILTAATVLGAGYLLDGRGQSNRMAAYGIGTLGGTFTFNLFDGDEAPKGYVPPKMEQKNSQSVNLNINVPDSHPEYIVTQDNHIKVIQKEKRKGGKIFTHTSPLFQK